MGAFGNSVRTESLKREGVLENQKLTAGTMGEGTQTSGEIKAPRESFGDFLFLGVMALSYLIPFSIALSPRLTELFQRRKLGVALSYSISPPCPVCTGEGMYGLGQRVDTSCHSGTVILCMAVIYGVFALTFLSLLAYAYFSAQEREVSS